MGILSSAGKDAGVEAAKVAERALDEATDTVEKVAAGLQQTITAALEKGGIDAALLVNAALLEAQAWRLEIVEWRKMIEPLTCGVVVTVVPKGESE
jgi:hypothetical protein|tara:strand:+ start:919 stop:1206 length:288 start_codon:yes stop_codon:yes gene_type:complete